MTDITEIVLDIETTGLNLNEGDKIIEIACVEIKNRKKTGRVFHRYINPNRMISREAISVHGITNEFLLDKPTFSAVAKEFDEFLKLSNYSFIVAHNAIAFDIKFMNHELSSCGINLIPDEKVIDSLLLARKKFPGSPASLDALCKRFNISLANRQKHSALVDAELLASVYILMQGHNQICLEMHDAEVDDEMPIAHKINGRSFKPSNLELEMHEVMLKKLNEPLWLKYDKHI